MLDEPLSGLDSFTALQLMRSLQAVAASGRVVALSLHQPSPALFGALDSAMLLAAGLVVYSGPPSAAADALAGLGCPVPPGKDIERWQRVALSGRGRRAQAATLHRSPSLLGTHSGTQPAREGTVLTGPILKLDKSLQCTMTPLASTPTPLP